MNLEELLRRPAWWNQAACRRENPLERHHITAIMFDPARTIEAKAICRPCKVRRECLAAALRHREPAGVWGGFTTAERDELAKARTPEKISETLHKFAQRDRSSRQRTS